MSTAIATLQKIGDIRIVRYLLASGFATVADLGSFLILFAIGVAAVPASVAGYTLGIAAHWLISSRAVFADGLSPHGAGRRRQKVLFVLSAFLGLGLTTAIVAAGEMAGVDVRLAKIVAMGASFASTWLLRSRMIFRVERI